MALVGREFPLPVYNFRVELDGAALSFAEVSGLVMERRTETYRHGLSFAEGEDVTKFAFEKFVPVTFKRGTVHGATELAEWLDEKEPRRLDVRLCDEEGAPLVTWKIERALPVKLTAPTLSASSNELAIESLEVMASGLKVEHH